MLQRTYERARHVFEENDIFIATDSKKIKQVANQFTKNVVLTSEGCLTGTDRLAEFAKIIDADAYVNLQGDEPIMCVENIKIIKENAETDPNTIYNGYAPIAYHGDYFSNMIPKVVVANSEKLLYMSRSPIPGNKTGSFQRSNKQICVYSFPKYALNNYGLGTTKTANESEEDIEIMRLLDLGIEIQMIEMSPNTVAVDTPEDLERVRMIIETYGEDLVEYDCG
jgi:3-deoxy-manno-octulosonate cytidylyltransferase (CMP-KDO synthetase)